MSPIHLRCLLAAGALCLLAGCAGPSGGTPPVTTTLFKHTASRQCETQPSGAARLQTEVAALKRAGIEVLSAQCGDDGNLYPAVCGGGTGDVWIVSVEAEALSGMQSRGYRPLDPALPITTQPCRQ